MRRMSNAVTRWFIIVNRTKKREGLTHPRTQIATRTDPDLLGEDKHLTKDVVDGLTRRSVKTDM
jgi:hypothetical protein